MPLAKRAPLVSGTPRPTHRRGLLASALAAAPAVLWPGRALPQGGPAIAVVVHGGTKVVRLSEAELAAIFAGNRKAWSDGAAIRLFNLPLGHPVRVEFDRVVLSMTPEQVSRYWLDRRIRGEGTPPRQIPSPELLARLVLALAGAISYLPEDKVIPGLRVVARVRQGKVVGP